MSGRFVHLEFHDKYEMFYLVWGRETFYDRDRQLRLWRDPRNARVWLENHYPHLTFVVRPEDEVYFDPELNDLPEQWIREDQLQAPKQMKLELDQSDVVK